MAADVLSKILELLQKTGVNFQEFHHVPTYTSEESARVRGEDLRSGAKAILMKTDEAFQMFVVPANAKIDSAAIKRRLKVKKTRFATREELAELTGLVPGCVPPFGEPVLPFVLYSDTEVGKATERVAFNAGSLTVSVIMAADDWDKIAKPIRFSFALGG